jgi:predicted acyl esterase
VGIAHGSVGQVYVTDAVPGTDLDLLNPGGGVVQTGTTDSVGSLIFRCTADLGCVNLPVGPGYRVALTANHSVVSGPVTVTAWDDPPDPSFYASQVIGPQTQGDCDDSITKNQTVAPSTCAKYGYLKTRDQTLLAYSVYLPDVPEHGPYPTVVEYSGYDPANPGHLQPSSLLANFEGYAVLGVNMRGTGCSGGAYDFFEPLQSTDGYDIIEAVAQQPWTLKDESGNAKIGMVGISFPGITQLFVAQLQPPHLAAIAPLSVVSDTGRGTLFPGGILNDGFAVSWASDRQHDAMPYPGGQPWSVDRINQGDPVCLANQKLRRQAPDIMEMIQENQYYVPAVDDPLTPATFVNKINVPVFLAGAWQDEQVGGYVATMLDKFDPSNTKVHFTLVNGNHSEPLTPAIFARWLEFLSFYVRHEIPHANALDQLVMTVGVANQAPFRHLDPSDPQYLPDCAFTLPGDRFKNDTDYDTALAKFESDPRIRVLFDNGSGDLSSVCPSGTPAYPGAPVPAFEAGFDAWPIPDTTATRWYFGKGDVGTDGALTTLPPTDQDAADAFSYEDTNAHTTDLQAGAGGDDTWLPQPPWNWQPLMDGKAIAYATPPLDHDVVMIGSGSVDVWFKANAPDVDLQFTLSEIRPDQGDGVKEVYVQNGWGRASRRKLDEDLSTELRPIATGTEADVEFLDPAGDYVFGRAELFPFAHVFRAGSRIRLSVESPGGDRPLWTFQAVSVPSTVDIARSAAHPSSIVLPVIPSVTVPASAQLPPCPSLRGQPCRDYVPLTNAGP